MNAKGTQNPALTGRLAWLEITARLIADETGIHNMQIVEDAVILAFEGILNDPRTNGVVTRSLLLSRSRAEIARWITGVT